MTVPIVMICSNKFLNTCTNVIYQISKTFQPSYNNPNIEFLILSKDIGENDKRKLVYWINGFGYSVRFFDLINDYYNYFDSYNFSNTLTNDKNFYNLLLVKLILPFIIPKYEKFLLIDLDIFVRKNISDLLDINLDGYSLGMVVDVANSIHSKRLFGYSSPYYFNCGIILFNAKRIRELYDCQSMISLIQSNSLSFKIPDQDLFNFIFQNDILSISTRWNQHHYFHQAFRHFIPIDKDDFNRFKDDPSIVHYVGKDKIWIPGVNRPYKNEYLILQEENSYMKTNS